MQEKPENKNTDDKVYALLKSMIKDPESYFDEDVASYLITKLDNKRIDYKGITLYGGKNFQIKCNLLGSVLCNQIYKFKENDLEDYQKWLTILKEKYSNLIEYPTIIFEPSSKSQQYPQFSKPIALSADFHTFYAMKNLSDWYKKKDDVFYGRPLGEINNCIFTLEYLADEQNSRLFGGTQKQEEQERINYILDKIIEGKKEVIKNGYHNESTFTNRIMNSQNMKVILEAGHEENILELFKNSPSGVILKIATNDNFLCDCPNFLEKVLPLETPIRWLKSWNRECASPLDSFNFIKLFNSRFHDAYGINIEEKTQKKGAKKERNYIREKSVIQLKKELEFFLPAIMEMKYDKVGFCHLFNAIMRTKDDSLMEIFLKFAPQPTLGMDNSKEYTNAYYLVESTLNASQFIQYKGVNYNSWKTWFSRYMMDELNNSIPNNDQLTKKNMKI